MVVVFGTLRIKNPAFFGNIFLNFTPPPPPPLHTAREKKFIYTCILVYVGFIYFENRFSSCMVWGILILYLSYLYLYLGGHHEIIA
jgi:hypothetical protein